MRLHGSNPPGPAMPIVEAGAVKAIIEAMKNDVVSHRAKCLEAALMRFVTRDTTIALPRGRGTKRKAPHGAAVRKALLELTGDPFHLLVCGRGRSLKDDTRGIW